MIASIHQLHSRPAPVGAFIRIGHSGHRKIESLDASGRFPFRRVVFDASHLKQQQDVLQSLKRKGYEIVLDPNFAEMGLARYDSSVGKLPWANPARPWAPADFGRARNLDVARAIAEFAVEAGVDAVLTPTNLVEAMPDEWRSINFEMCDGLRVALDRLGANSIAIDYQLITTMAVLKDVSMRDRLIHGITDLPIQNAWLRTSGFGATATGAGTRQFIEACSNLAELGVPIVADGVGGFAGLAAAAFGVAGAICHGVGQKESFQANHWKSPPSGGGGTTSRIYIPELDRYFKEVQLNAVFHARYGRSLFGCNNTGCCPRGIEDMVENPISHFIGQRSRQLDELSSVSEVRRAEHLLLRQLAPAVRTARRGSRLRIDDDKVKAVVVAAYSRLIRMHDALADILEGDVTISRVRSPLFRGGRGAAAGAALGH
jgi:hypothetical protein